jgi:hypothetical protein
VIETTETAELYRYKEGDEERIIGLLQEHADDGISAFAMCTQLGIKFQPLNAILERLQRNGQARLVRRKSGAIYWYPDDQPPAKPIPQPVEKAPAPPAVSPDPAEQDPVPEDEGRVPCPVEGCRSTIKRKHKSVYTHLYGLHGLRGDKLHARLDEVLGTDRLRRTPIGETASRPCPFPRCTSSFTGRHARASVINHMIQRHEVDREGAKLIADGKLAPPDMGTAVEDVSKKPISEPITDPAVDADIIPPSEVECEGCECLHDGECEQGEECVCNCATKMEQLEDDLRVDISRCDCDEVCTCIPVSVVASEIPECDGDACRIGPLPVREDLPMPRPAPGPRDIPNTCTPIDVRQVTIRTTERPEDEPTPLARICSLAVELEALAARHGFSVQVDIDTYVGAAPQMQLKARRKGVSE